VATLVGLKLRGPAAPNLNADDDRSSAGMLSAHRTRVRACYILLQEPEPCYITDFKLLANTRHRGKQSACSARILMAVASHCIVWPSLRGDERGECRGGAQRDADGLCRGCRRTTGRKSGGLRLRRGRTLRHNRPDWSAHWTGSADRSTRSTPVGPLIIEQCASARTPGQSGHCLGGTD
jgi:hypothetical protein